MPRTACSLLLSLLVALPIGTGLIGRDQVQAALQENYYKAMERLKQTQPNWPDQNRHAEAYRQAAALGSSSLPGYLSQAIGACMIIAGIVMGRSRPVGSPANESITRSGTASNPVDSSTAIQASERGR